MEISLRKKKTDFGFSEHSEYFSRTHTLGTGLGLWILALIRNLYCKEERLSLDKQVKEGLRLSGLIRCHWELWHRRVARQVTWRSEVQRVSLVLLLLLLFLCEAHGGLKWISPHLSFLSPRIPNICHYVLQLPTCLKCIRKIYVLI